jgi:hypothetical protein
LLWGLLDMNTQSKNRWMGWLTLACGVAVATGCAAGGPTEVGDGTEMYRIRAVVLPGSYEEARQLAFDLDGDGKRDNAAGSTLVSLFSNFEEAGPLISAAANAALAHDVAWYLRVERDPATGVVHALSIAAREEAAWDTMPATLLADALGDSPVKWVEVRQFTADLQVEHDGTLSGRIGFGIPEEALTVFAAPMARFFTKLLREGRLKVTATMDVNGDGVITAEELLEFELVRMMLKADLDLDGDGVADSWSTGIGIRARPLHGGGLDQEQVVD